jgi:hypothetical protein
LPDLRPHAEQALHHPEGDVDLPADNDLPRRAQVAPIARLQAISLDLPIKRAADIRQAEAKLEMLKAGG